MQWDLFCRVIDNHGDIGVCWRLACNLALRGQRVRLWVDDPSALGWMAPQGQPGVEVQAWRDDTDFPAPADVVVEAFGCDLPEAFVHRMAGRSPPSRWINLEYLTAEGYAERSHGLPSPVLAGAGKGLSKTFFFPGFTRGTGGLLREPDLLQRQVRFDRAAWLRHLGVQPAEARIVSLFCYEPPALPLLLEQLAQAEEKTQLLVTAGRAASAVRACLEQEPPRGGPSARLAVHYLPLLTQPDYDHLLWACDFNFVRGEDSLVRALWAGRPFAWQIYPQQDGAHAAKLDAFLDWLQAPSSLRRFHHGWNGLDGVLPALDLPAWGACATHARERLLAQADLATQLLRSVGA